MSRLSQRQIDFSVVIPTYNRSKLLQKAIKSALRQEGVIFEIIVCDNDSPDDTEKVVKGFKDTKIKYFKNKKNFGHQYNMKKCLRLSKGKYIFCLGDDDFILEKNTLLIAQKFMDQYKVGIGTIGTIYFSKSPQIPCKLFVLNDRVVIVKPKSDKKVPIKALDFNFTFFTGLIFDNSIIDVEKMTNNFNYTYYPLVLDAIQKKGIGYIPNLFVGGHISLRFVPQYYSLDKLGSFYMEDYLKMMREFLNARDYENHKKKFLQGSTILLPSIKLFTNNKNYLQVLQKFIALDQSLLWNLKFIAMTIIGFLPKFTLKFLRNLIIYREEKKIAKIVSRYNYVQKLEKLGV